VPEVGHLWSDLPDSIQAETFTTLLCMPGVRIERIVSQGQSSPEVGWYDQVENEWVIVLKGRGCLQFEDGTELVLGPGDFVDLPAHCRHRVAWTDSTEVTVWLAVFYPQDAGFQRP